MIGNKLWSTQSWGSNMWNSLSLLITRLTCILNTAICFDCFTSSLVLRVDFETEGGRMIHFLASSKRDKSLNPLSAITALLGGKHSKKLQSCTIMTSVTLPLGRAKPVFRFWWKPETGQNLPIFQNRFWETKPEFSPVFPLLNYILT